MPNLERLNHFYYLNKKTILDCGSPHAKFIQLPQTSPQRESVKETLLKEPNIKKIIKKLSDPISGIHSFSRTPADYRVYGSFFWGLRFLADIGLSGNELGISEFTKRLQFQQLEDGQFMVRYHRKKQQTISLVCMTAHLTYCLICLGYKESNTVKTALNFILTTQRKDGGWHCDRLKQLGELNQAAPSCPAANIHVIRALGQFGKKFIAFAEPATRQLVKIFNHNSILHCEFDSRQCLNFNKLRYPPHYTGLDILNVIHSLSFFPDLMVNSDFESLVNMVLNRWDGKNWLRSEKRIPEWSTFDFGKKSGYSEWLTSLFLQAIERVYVKN